ncbi:MAG: tetratricopeptide repeat protein, partial [Methanospirillum sp.]|uniref:tetratricopeptide repeat protein n=1 Tax=Methanospirillum sp. TaxID=45200 RepID=UPI00236A04CC
HKEAIQCYDRTLRLDPRHVGALMNKGTILDDLGAKREAFLCFQKASTIDPKVATTLKIKGRFAH